MPHFIKTGFWDCLSTAPKNYLNIDQVISCAIACCGGGGGGLITCGDAIYSAKRDCAYNVAYCNTTNSFGFNNTSCLTMSDIHGGLMNVIGDGALGLAVGGTFFRSFNGSGETQLGVTGDFTYYFTPGSTISGAYLGDALCNGSNQSCFINIPITGSSFSGGYTTICVNPANIPDLGRSYGLVKTSPITSSSYSATYSSYAPNAIVGGVLNTISGYYGYGNGFIGVGYGNTVSGGYGSIVNGFLNKLCFGGFIGGGAYHSVYGDSFIGAGNSHTACNSSFIGNGTSSVTCSYSFIGTAIASEAYNYSSIVGGYLNCANNSSFVGGGICNYSLGLYSSILGGYQNCAGSGESSTIVSGKFNCITFGSMSTVAGGCCNVLQSGYNSAIVSGTLNTLNGCDTTISGGCANRTLSGVYSSFIGSGARNTIDFGACSSVLGGLCNSITCAGLSSILGGCCNVVTHDRVFVAGQNITSSMPGALYANQLVLCNLPTSTSGLPSGAVWRDTGAGDVLKIVP